MNGEVVKIHCAFEDASADDHARSCEKGSECVRQTVSFLKGGNKFSERDITTIAASTQFSLFEREDQLSTDTYK